MKRLLLLLTLSFLVVGMIYAQKPPKGNPTKAESYLAKNELEKAKAEIDKAVTLEKHSGKQDVWITRGNVYQAIAVAGDDEAIGSAMESYAKAKEIDPESNAAQLLDLQNISQFHGNYFNIASEAYNAEDYDKSLNSFSKALKVIPDDSTTLYYAALAAYQGDNQEVTLDLYEVMIEMNYADKELYGSAIFIAKETLKDTDRAMTLIKMGHKTDAMIALKNLVTNGTHAEDALYNTIDWMGQDGVPLVEPYFENAPQKPNKVMSYLARLHGIDVQRNAEPKIRK